MHHVRQEKTRHLIRFLLKKSSLQTVVLTRKVNGCFTTADLSSCTPCKALAGVRMVGEKNFQLIPSNVDDNANKSASHGSCCKVKLRSVV